MFDREEDRERKLQFHNDVFYEVWRSGGNTDRINYDAVEDNYYGHRDVDIAAREELRKQQSRKAEDLDV